MLYGFNTMGVIGVDPVILGILALVAGIAWISGA